MSRKSLRSKARGRHDFLMSLGKLSLNPWFLTATVMMEMLVVLLAFTALALAFTAVLILVEGLTSVLIIAGVNIVLMFALLSQRPVRTL